MQIIRKRSTLDICIFPDHRNLNKVYNITRGHTITTYSTVICNYCTTVERVISIQQHNNNNNNICLKSTT